MTNVLVTLGGSGAVLVTTDGAWFAPHPRSPSAAPWVRGLVGGGLHPRRPAGDGPAGCLASAVAYGSAAAALPSTTLPRPMDAESLVPTVVAVG
ncbi:hypothetical protein [Tessaracoccus coleopterorum]|uniref:hypothetical protein n=1 Tax=Tessaracoccus coleopterorum TaxID=2714950 RepID=UPI0018D49C71|nr:hypothetical protein [Tessaracoccus coleopterorum]